jgi:hypothetical protein
VCRIDAVRWTLTAAAALATMTLAAEVAAAPHAVLTRDLGELDALDANGDGRAWARGGASPSQRAFVLGPGDEVRRLDDAAAAPWEVAPPSLAGRLALGGDGTIVRDGEPAPLSDALLHALGPKDDRRALVYDAARDRYVLLRARRPRLSGGYDDAWSLVWFTPERILDEAVLPDEVDMRRRPALAASDGVVWIGEPAGALRWRDGGWTEFGDEALVQKRRDDVANERKSFLTTAALFGGGNALSSSLFSLPVSLAGKQRYLPTAATSYVASFPAILTASTLAFGANIGGGKWGEPFSFVAYVIGIGSIPVVAFTTYATGEVGFRGTNEGAFLGALGGAASGALLWTLASVALPERSFIEYSWLLLPLGAGFIGSTSSAGYLWAGHGFTHY